MGIGRKLRKAVKKVGKVVAIGAAIYFGAPYLLAAASAAAPYAGAAASLAAARSRRSGGTVEVAGSGPPIFAPTFAPSTPGVEYAGLGGGGAMTQMYPGGGADLPSGPSPMMLATIAGVGIAFITLLVALRR